MGIIYGLTTKFTYGADGLRRSMTVNGITTYYAYDGTMLVQEFQTNAQTGRLAPTATYMLGPSGPICRINETEQTEGYYLPGVTAKAPLGRGVTHWYVYDGLGSVIAELDDNNNLTTSGQFDVYGAPRAGTRQGGSPTSSQGYVGELGHVTDAGTGGLIYMQARYYDPGLGRFVSEDPSCNGANWYTYCNNNPTNETDSNGKMPQWLTDVLAGLATIGVGVGIMFAAQAWKASILASVAASADTAIAGSELAEVLVALAASVGTAAALYTGIGFVIALIGIGVGAYFLSQGVSHELDSLDADPAMAIVPEIDGMGIGEATAIAELTS
jgi:RHS repeat-associated protein